MSPLDRAMNVLLVDDDALDAEIVRRALARVNARASVLVAGSGGEALKLLQGGTVSLHRLLVLLDLNMPQMAGLDVLRAMRRDPRLSHIPVVVLTGSQSEKERVDSFGLHAAGFLRKPTDEAGYTELITALSRYWGSVEFP